MQRHLYNLLALALIAFLQFGIQPSLAQQKSDGLYRIPYANGTSVKVTRDHLTHFSGSTLTTRIDMIGTGGSGDYAIVAAADGIIRWIEDSFDKRLNCGILNVASENNYVWIEHPNGEWSKYSHMKKGSTSGPGSFGANLKVGDSVKAGDFLGWESDVGCASGDHLHFEIANLNDDGDFTETGGFIRNGFSNFIPRMCAVAGEIFEADKTYTSVGFGIPVYRDKNYKGQARALTGPNFNYPDLHGLGFGDNISSVMTACPEKLYALFYEHKDYKGRAYYYRGGRVKDLGKLGFNDNISSAKVFSKPINGITVYEHKNTTGKATFLAKSIADLSTLGMDNKISSIKVHGNLKVEVYTGKNFTGGKREVTKLIYDTKDIGMNDNISSIKFIPPPFKVTKASLKFSVDERNSCPKKITVVTEFESNKAGTVTYRRERQGGDPSGWVTLQSKKIGGKFIATKTETQWVNNLDQMRRVKVKDSNVASAWEHYKVTCPPFKVTKVRYAFRVAAGYLCPRDVEIIESYTANGPGTFKRRRERQGGPPSDWVDTEVKLNGTNYQVTFKSTQKVGETLQTRRVVAKSRTGKSWKIESDWTPLLVNCLDIEKSAIIFDGKSAGTCKYKSKVKLRVNADMQGNIPYKLQCNDGQSRDGIFYIKKTGANTFIGVDTVDLDVKKTGKQICALKADVGGGLKNLTLQGKDFTCNDVLDAAIYIDGPKQSACPAKLPVRVRVNARDKKAVGFNLKCSTGENWNGKLKVKKTAPNTYIGVLKKSVKVRKSGKIACALRSTLSGASKVIALRGKDFKCIAGAVTTPNPVVKISCRGGVVQGKNCICKRGWNPRKLGNHRYVCQKSTITPIKCIGGKPNGKRCLCPKHAVAKKFNSKTFRCQCKKGRKLIRGVCAKIAG